MLVLLGNVQQPTYAHPKLLGHCYDNVYHQGQFIRDLPARGKLPTKEQTQKIYNQEYEEVVAQIEDTLDLSKESLLYPMVPTSLRNPEIILPLSQFQQRMGLQELPPGRMPEPQEYELDGAHGLVDLSWSQSAPQVQPDDVDRDQRYNQYPYQEGEDYDDEEMEVYDRVLGKTGGACMAAPSSTRCPYQCPEATYAGYPTAGDQTLGLPRSIHTDRDVAMEMGGLGMSSG